MIFVKVKALGGRFEFVNVANIFKVSDDGAGGCKIMSTDGLEFSYTTPVHEVLNSVAYPVLAIKVADSSGAMQGP